MLTKRLYLKTPTKLTRLPLKKSSLILPEARQYMIKLPEAGQFEIKLPEKLRLVVIKLPEVAKNLLSIHLLRL